VEAEFFHAESQTDRRTDRDADRQTQRDRRRRIEGEIDTTKLIVAFPKFAKAPKN
jgi:hypothetical protein